MQYVCVGCLDPISGANIFVFILFSNSNFFNFPVSIDFMVCSFLVLPADNFINLTLYNYTTLKGETMEEHEELIHGKVKKVGNSVAIFVSAEERDKYQLKPETEIIVALRAKKVRRSIFGMARGKLGPFTEKDRADYHGE